MAGRGDHPCIGAEAGKRMRGAPGIGDRRTSSQTAAAEAIDETGEHQLLATLKMLCSLRIHDDTIRRIHGDHRRVLRQGPERQPFENRKVGSRIGIDHQQALDQRLRLGGREGPA